MRGFRSSNAVGIGILGFATPPFLHYEQARAALPGGKHVIVLAVYANIIADATAMDPDEMFQLNLMTQPPGL